MWCFGFPSIGSPSIWLSFLACIPDTSFLCVIAHLCIASSWGQEVRKDGREALVCVQLENLQCFAMAAKVKGQEDPVSPWVDLKPRRSMRCSALALPPNDKAESNGKTCRAKRVVKEIQQNTKDVNCPLYSPTPTPAVSLTIQSSICTPVIGCYPHPASCPFENWLHPLLPRPSSLQTSTTRSLPPLRSDHACLVHPSTNTEPTGYFMSHTYQQSQLMTIIFPSRVLQDATWFLAFCPLFFTLFPPPRNSSLPSPLFIQTPIYTLRPSWNFRPYRGSLCESDEAYGPCSE